MVRVILCNSDVVSSLVYCLLNIVILDEVILFQIQAKVAMHLIVVDIRIIEHELNVEKMRTEKPVPLKSICDELVESLLRSSLNDFICKVAHFIFLDDKT